MHCSSKRLVFVFIFLFSCSNLSYCIEGPESSNSSTVEFITPQPTSIPEPVVSPIPITSPAPIPSSGPAITGQDAQPSLIPPADSADDEREEQMEAEVKEQEKVKFYNEIEAIVTKHINNFYKNGGKGTIGVYIKELGTNYEYGFNAEKTNPENPEEGYFMTASTCKLLSAAVIYYLDNNNEMELDKTCTDNVSKAKYNLKSLIPRMISHSVNGYFNITLRHLGSQKINEILEKLEVKNSLVYSEIMPAPYTSVKNNIKRYGISKSPRTTPKDLGYVLWLLYDGKTFGAENDKMLTEALKSSIYSNRLPQGIGHKSPVGHKTGTSAGDGVYNDAGIIYLKDNPYIMVVMSRGSGSGVQAAYRSMAMEVYKYMSKRIPSKSETQESKKGFY